MAIGIPGSHFFICHGMFPMNNVRIRSGISSASLSRRNSMFKEKLKFKKKEKYFVKEKAKSSMRCCLAIFLF